jgi:hypothetical protein
MSAEERPFEEDTTVEAINNVLETLGVDPVEGTSENVDTESTLPPEQMDVPAVREAVSRQLDLYHQRIRSSLGPDAESDDQGPFSGRGTARAALLTVLIHRAGARGDTEQVDEYMTTLEMLSAAGMRSSHVTKIQIRAMRYGSLKAYDGLHRTLAEEQEYRLGWTDGGGPNAPLESARFTLLADAISELTVAGLPAEQLIDTYSTDPIDRLSHYLRYVRLCREKKTPQERIDALEEAIAEAYLLLPDATAYARYSPELIMSVRDEHRRRAMYDRFISAQKARMAEGAQGVNKADYTSLLDALVSIPPSAISPENRLYLHRLGRTALESFKATGLEPWVIDATVAMAATPQQVIEFTNRIADVDKRRLSEEHTKLTRDMDNIFGKYARRYAECGDFEAANVFINAMTSTYKGSETIAECMKHAQTARQRSYLQADGLQQLVYPELDINWRIAEAMSLRDNQKLEAAIRDLVDYATEAYSNPSDSVEADDRLKEYRDISLLDDAFACMDPERALALAREIKAQASQGPPAARGESVRPMMILGHLSEVLLRLGDPEEIRRKYTAAFNAGADEAMGMVEYIQLAESFFPPA